MPTDSLPNTISIVHYNMHCTTNKSTPTNKCSTEFECKLSKRLRDEPAHRVWGTNKALAGEHSMCIKIKRRQFILPKLSQHEID